MNPKHIEMQVDGNYQEGKQLQQQIAQMSAGNPQRQQLANRLEMIIRSQSYWAKEYFKLTGKELNITPLQTTSAPNFPAKLIETEAEKANLARERERLEWRATRIQIKTALLGDPNYVRVSIYLDMLERTYGDNVPKLPRAIVFGKAKVAIKQNHQATHKAPLQDYYGTEIKENSSVYFEDKGSVIIFANGSVAKSDKNSLFLLGASKRTEQTFPGKMGGKIENWKELKAALRGNSE